MPFIPTDEQKAVLDWARTGIGNAIIDARAGTGKSTLIEHCIREIYSRKPSEKVIYFAFNKTIVESMKKRFGDEFPNLVITTCHSFGLKIIKENLGNSVTLNEYKYLSKFDEWMADEDSDDFILLSDNDRLKYRANVRKLVDYARYNKCQKEKEIERISEKYGLRLVYNEAYIVEKLLKWGSSHTDTIDYTDMIWLPCENVMNTRGLYNFMFVDEAQDLSPIEQELVYKCLDKRRGRSVIVGDRYQAINAWAGADEIAFDRYAKYKNTRQFSLTVCQRCSKSVIREAQKIVPSIVARENAVEGSVSRYVSEMAPQDGDMVLCRLNLPLIEYYEFLLKSGKKAYICESSASEHLVDEIEQCVSDDVDKNMENDGIVPSLYNRLFDSIEKEMTRHGISAQEAIERSQSITNEYDTIRTIETLSSSDMKKNELIDKINGIFNNPSVEGIKLSSMHRAKGEEADNVFILCPSLMNSRLVSEDWEIIQEKNLEYVMITRAKDSLNYLKEDTFKPWLRSNTGTTITELNRVADKIGRPRFS